MSRYRLLVFETHAVTPVETRAVERATEILAAMEALLSRHPDCHRIRIEGPGGRLFAVGCDGKTVSA